MTGSATQRRIRRIEQTRPRRIEQAMAAVRMLNPAAVAYDLFAMAKRYPERDAEVRALRARFLDLLHDQGQDDLLERQIQYAIRLASSGGELIQEETFKLFSLCAEIEALQFLGLKVSADLDEKFTDALRLCFKRGKRDLNIAAMCYFERGKQVGGMQRIHEIWRSC